MARCSLSRGKATPDARIAGAVASGMLNLRAVMTSSQFGTNSREEKFVFEFLLTGVSKMLILHDFLSYTNFDNYDSLLSLTLLFVYFFEEMDHK